MRFLSWCILLMAALACSAGEWRLDPPITYYGMCDASAAVPAGPDRFIVANDEDNVLRVYDAHRSSPPLQQFDLDDFLAVDEKHPETDLEAAALMGQRAFWMGSHGRNKDGKPRPSRCRFFATDIQLQGGRVDLAPVGQPYTRLLEDLLAHPALAPFDLAEASQLAPKDSGALDIEGLAATPEGTLLIGFRNPVPRGKALVVPLLNPNEVVQGSAARLGPPVLLDLGGLAVRDMVRYSGGYLIIAGRFDSGGRSRLYRWRGPGSEPEKMPTPPLRGFNPEALLLYPESPGQILLLSDDGTREVLGAECKSLPDPLQRMFRAFWLRE